MDKILLVVAVLVTLLGGAWGDFAQPSTPIVLVPGIGDSKQYSAGTKLWVVFMHPDNKQALQASQTQLDAMQVEYDHQQKVLIAWSVVAFVMAGVACVSTTAAIWLFVRAHHRNNTTVYSAVSNAEL